MIYIHGFRFIYNPVSQVSQNAPIQQQIALARRNPSAQRTQKKEIFDERFKQGKEYRIARIRKELDEDKKEKVVYTFASTTDKQEDIEVYFSNTVDAENYIAAMSGQTGRLREERDKISKNIAANADS